MPKSSSGVVSKQRLAIRAAVSAVPRRLRGEVIDADESRSESIWVGVGVRWVGVGVGGRVTSRDRR